MGIYFSRIELFLIIVNICLLLFIIQKTRNIFHYLAFFSVIVLSLIILGSINLWFFQDVIGWYKGINSKEVNTYSLFALLLYNIALVVFMRKSKYAYINPISITSLKEVIDKGRLFNIIIWFSLIGAVTNIINFYSYGGVPVLASKLTGLERFDFAQTILIPRFPILSSVTVLLVLTYIVLYKDKRIFMLILLFISLFLSFSIGSRHILLQPIMLFLIMMVNFKPPIMRKQLLLVSLLPFLVVSLLSLRGDKVNINNYYESFSLIGGEYRDFILLREQYDYKEFLWGKSFISIIVNPIPDFLLFGKKEELQLYTAYIAEDIWGSTTGIRVGIWGEFFMNFGLIGMIVLFFLLAFPVSWLSKNVYKNVKKYFILNYIYLLLIFGSIGSWGTIGDDIGSFGIAYMIIYFIVFRKQEGRIVNN